ncbi:unnamed protein product, partial [Sphacelaria rigidula]
PPRGKFGCATKTGEDNRSPTLYSRSGQRRSVRRSSDTQHSACQELSATTIWWNLGPNAPEQRQQRREARNNRPASLPPRTGAGRSNEATPTAPTVAPSAPSHQRERSG